MFAVILNFYIIFYKLFYMFLSLLKEFIDISKKASLTFYDYMNFSLYSSRLGFYSKYKKWKPNETYSTLPNNSMFFPFLFAIRIDSILRKNPNLGILEIGPGSGLFCINIVFFLKKFGSPFVKYLLLEYNCSSCFYQYSLVKRKKYLKEILWIKHIPYGFMGIILANEILDAIPFYCFSFKNYSFFEKRVSYNNIQLNWFFQRYTFYIRFKDFNNYVKHISKNKNFIQFFEWCFYYLYFLIIIKRFIKKSIFYFFDYGFLNQTSFINTQSRGLMRCFFSYSTQNSPFILPGRQDITAYVNFFYFKKKFDYFFLLDFYKFFLYNNFVFFFNSVDLSKRLQILFFNEIKLCFSFDKMSTIFKIIFLYEDITKF